jgi:hypothetical protein
VPAISSMLIKTKFSSNLGCIIINIAGRNIYCMESFQHGAMDDKANHMVDDFVKVAVLLRAPNL